MKPDPRIDLTGRPLEFVPLNELLSEIRDRADALILHIDYTDERGQSYLTAIKGDPIYLYGLAHFRVQKKIVQHIRMEEQCGEPDDPPSQERSP